ncbi:MAG TPA: hypothetical protein VMT88_10640 [Actinomycetes bacterium]|nr:hypothetical protein [Actinomycetes bacterium]
MSPAPRVREAAGLPPRSAPEVALAGIVALLQGIVVAAVGGALVYPIANVLSWI